MIQRNQYGVPIAYSASPTNAANGLKTLVAGGFAAFALFRKPVYDTKNYAVATDGTMTTAELATMVKDGFDAQRQGEKVAAIGVLVDSGIDLLFGT